ncbi:hypothetical protein HAX54_037529 [Datura stramonium]|uniref:Uncharacterized protein n=1 Tax=Datura stramonium TaxID=4076 RepID=A0ABS8VLM6_DATST|nr:hypothetical protein [Datura stramonium]
MNPPASLRWLVEHSPENTGHVIMKPNSKAHNCLGQAGELVVGPVSVENTKIRYISSIKSDQRGKAEDREVNREKGFLEFGGQVSESRIKSSSSLSQLYSVNFSGSSCCVFGLTAGLAFTNWGFGFGPLVSFQLGFEWAWPVLSAGWFLLVVLDFDSLRSFSNWESDRRVLILKALFVLAEPKPEEVLICLPNILLLLRHSGLDLTCAGMTERMNKTKKQDKVLKVPSSCRSGREPYVLKSWLCSHDQRLLQDHKASSGSEF